MPANPNLRQQFQNILGERIQAQRREARLTQLALSKQLTVSRATLANVEAGTQRASAFLLAQLAQALNVSAQKLLPSLSEAQARHEEARTVSLDADTVPKLLRRSLEELDLSVAKTTTLKDTLEAVGVRQTHRNKPPRK